MTERRARVKIRKMNQADLPTVKATDLLLFGDSRLPTWPFSFEEYWTAYRPDISFVAELDGRVAGFIVGTVVVEEHSYSVLNLRKASARPPRYRQVGWIDMIGVHPEHQHSGIGRSLVEAFCSECGRINAVVKGVAAADDDRLKRFLETAGFKLGNLVVYERDPSSP
jgi:ribosomal protein S18 acetylase RimI-like enzyme